MVDIVRISIYWVTRIDQMWNRDKFEYANVPFDFRSQYRENGIW